MNPHEERAPRIDASIRPAEAIGMYGLFKLAMGGADLEKALETLLAMGRSTPDDLAIPYDLFLLYFTMERVAEMEEAGNRALAAQRLYRIGGPSGPPAADSVSLRVLALVAEGSPTYNVPIDFILSGTDVRLDFLYLGAGEPLPAAVPEHDLVFIALSEPDLNLALLQRLARIAPSWPRPVVNDPARIAPLSRDGVYALLNGAEGIAIPPSVRLPRAAVERIAAGEPGAWETAAAGLSFPLIVRPLGSHAGKQLEKIADAAELRAYLSEIAAAEAADFYLAPFIDYRSADGRFWKYRVMFIGGEPFLCHLAISDHWMIHYVNADMAGSAAKRAEEARAMKEFDQAFALRHAAAFRELNRRLGLDYFGIDCAETPDGRLLIFEADTAMVIHALDSAELYPYKQEQMAKTFAAFRQFLIRKAGEAPGLPSRPPESGGRPA